MQRSCRHTYSLDNFQNKLYQRITRTSCERYRTQEVDNPDCAPTGSAYKIHAQMQREKVAEQRQPAQEHERLKAMKEEASNIFKDDDSEDEEIFEQVATFAAELKSENKRSSNVVMMDKFCVVLFCL